VSDVVVVGNGVSGYACAARLGEQGVSVTMIGPGLPHDRPPLSKRALVTGRVPLLAEAVKLTERGVEHVDGVVTSLDLDRRRLVVNGSAGGHPLEIEAPTLVWATGLRYPKPPVPGLDQAEENTTGRGLVSLTRKLACPPRRVVVVGAGLIGTETAATLAAAHDVTLLDMLDRPLARFLPRVSDAARDVLDRLGARFLGSCRIFASSRSASSRLLPSGTRTTDLSSVATVKAKSPAWFCSTSRRACARPANSSPQPVDDHQPSKCEEDTSMLVVVTVDPDTCIGSAECVALDPEAVELDEYGTARMLVAELEEERAQHLCEVCPIGALSIAQA
jgi:ferredoxin